MSSHRNMGKARSELAHRPRACLCAPGSMRRVKDAQRPRSGRINVAVGFNPRNTESMFATHRTRAAKGSSGRNQKLFSLRSLRPLRLGGELSVGKKASPQRRRVRRDYTEIFSLRRHQPVSRLTLPRAWFAS